MKKNKKKFGGSKKTPYLCTLNHKLGYGVMVTLQILVLPFLVLVRVPQHEKRFCLVRAKSLFRLYIS